MESALIISYAIEIIRAAAAIQKFESSTVFLKMQFSNIFLQFCIRRYIMHGGFFSIEYYIYYLKLLILKKEIINTLIKLIKVLISRTQNENQSHF